MRFGDLNREAGDEVKDIQVEASLAVGAGAIDADRAVIAVIGDTAPDGTKSRPFRA